MAGDGHARTAAPAHHAVALFVGRPNVLRRFRAALPDVRMFYLRPGSEIAVLPCDDLLRDALHVHHGTGEWPETQDVALSSTDMAFAAHCSNTGPLAYVETDYGREAGRQAACLWVGGAVVLKPIGMAFDVMAARPRPTWPINAALRGLGVTAGPGDDETEALGLLYYASNADVSARAIVVRD